MIGLCVTFGLMRVLPGISVGVESGRVDEILIAGDWCHGLLRLLAGFPRGVQRKSIPWPNCGRTDLDSVSEFSQNHEVSAR
jgi:hypothetical protein